MTNTSYIIPSAGQDLFFDGSHHRNHYSSYNSFNHSNFNNNYGYNSNSNSINKFGDIKTRGINGTSQSENAHLNYPFGDENFGQINVGQPNQRRVRHFSQQQSPMIWQQQNGQSDKESKFKSDLKESNQKIINGKTPNDDLSLINSFKFENNKIHEKENQKKDLKPEIDGKLMNFLNLN